MLGVRHAINRYITLLTVYGCRNFASLVRLTSSVRDSRRQDSDFSCHSSAVACQFLAGLAPSSLSLSFIVVFCFVFDSAVIMWYRPHFLCNSMLGYIKSLGLRMQFLLLYHFTCSIKIKKYKKNNA